MKISRESWIKFGPHVVTLLLVVSSLLLFTHKAQASELVLTCETKKQCDAYKLRFEQWIGKNASYTLPITDSESVKIYRSVDLNYTLSFAMWVTPQDTGSLRIGTHCINEKGCPADPNVALNNILIFILSK